MSEKSARDAPHDFRRHLPHFEGNGRCLYITFNTHNGFVLPPASRQQMLKHLLHDHDQKMSMICAVVMPDHIHFIYEPWCDEDGKRYTKTEIVGSMKSASAHAINRMLGRKGRLWQDESFDHVIRSYESLEAKALYVSMNPVRANLVKHEDEYPYLWRAWVEGIKKRGVTPES